MNRETRFLVLLSEAIAVVVLWSLLGAVFGNRLRSARSRLAALQARAAEDRAMAAAEKNIRKLDAQVWDLLLATEKFGLANALARDLPQKIATVATVSGVRLDRFANGRKTTVHAEHSKRTVLGKRMSYFLRIRGDYSQCLRFLERQRRELPALLLQNLRIQRQPVSPEEAVGKIVMDIEFDAPIFLGRLDAGDHE